MGLAETYAGRRVFVTGHTGFKGSWLAEWLGTLGAEVTGYALDPPTEPNLFDALDLGHARPPRRRRRPRSRPAGGRGPGSAAVGDLPPGCAGARPARVRGAARDLRDQRHGHGQHPRGGPRVPVGPRRRHRDERQGLRESRDRPGLSRRPTRWVAATRTAPARRAPSSSRRPTARASSRTAPAVASVRAGNVIGGGDWAPDRIIPDSVRALVAGEPDRRPQPGCRSAPGSTSSNRCPGTSRWAPAPARWPPLRGRLELRTDARNGPISRCAGWSSDSSPSGGPDRGRRRRVAKASHTRRSG